jgi:hypothetical protein
MPAMLPVNAGQWVFYNNGKRHLCDGAIDLDSDVFKMSLFTSASNAANTALTAAGSVTGEVAGAFGYVTSGKALPASTWLSGASASAFRFDSTAVVWTAVGGDIANIKYAVIYKVGASAGAKKLLMYCQLSTSQFTVTSGNTLSVQPSANGYFELL